MEGENRSSGDKNQVRYFKNGFYTYTDFDGVRCEDEAYRKLSEQPGFGTADMTEVKQIYLQEAGPVETVTDESSISEWSFMARRYGENS